MINFSTQPIGYAKGDIKHTPEVVTTLPQNHVFVFGSNEAGIHRAGAARTARKWGARVGRGSGMSGNTFAIPTKDSDIQTLELYEIKEYVSGFLIQAADNYQTVFLVTKIGCGLAGYHVDDIGPMFRGATPNVILPIEFEKYR